jgi:hypothetical protein
MSFEIKYNRDGEVIRDASLKQQLEKAAEAPVQEIQQPVYNAPEELLVAVDLPQQESTTVEEQVTQEEIIQEVPKQVYKRTPENSFKELRDAKERAERERDELMRKLSERESYNQHAQQKQQKITDLVEEPDFDLGVSDDDLLEGKHGKTIVQEVRKIKQQLAQERALLQEQRAAAQAQAVENKLRSQYPDFDKVVTPDTVSMLQYMDPEFSSGLNFKANPYATAVSAYLAIKEKGIYKNDSYIAEKQRVQDNAAKPRLSPASGSTQQSSSPLSKANEYAQGLTPQLQAQLLKEMNDIRKGH